MSKFRKKLQKQEFITCAVRSLARHFVEEANFYEHYRSMCDAQTAVMVLESHYRQELALNKNSKDDVDFNDVTEFFYLMSNLLNAVSDFAELIGQTSGDITAKDLDEELNEWISNE